jgi:hypothetical protein
VAGQFSHWSGDKLPDNLSTIAREDCLSAIEYLAVDVNIGWIEEVSIDGDSGNTFKCVNNRVVEGLAFDLQPAI